MELKQKPTHPLSTSHVVVHPGGGVVARWPGIVFLGSTGDTEIVADLLRICRAASSDPLPGRLLARQFGRLLADQHDHDPSFASLSAIEDGMAAFLAGDVRLRAANGLSLSGRDAAAWVDHIIGSPDTEIVLQLYGAEPSLDRPPGASDTSGAMTDELDLREGVVLGSGVTVGLAQPARPAASAQPAAPEPASVQVTPPTEPSEVAVQTPAAGPVPEPTPSPPEPDRSRKPVRASEPVPPPPHVDAPEPEDAPPPAVHVSLTALADEPEPAREPLPHTTMPIPHDQDDRKVKGYVCSRGHLNDPRVLFCATCGIRMSQRTGVLVEGARPPLGLLVFDTGATFVLDHDYILGREPQIDPRVQAEELFPLQMDDPHNQISRAHALVALRGWDVTISDAGSANGTYVAQPGQDAWVQVGADETVVLKRGAAVRLGSRTFTFESASAVP